MFTGVLGTIKRQQDTDSLHQELKNCGKQHWRPTQRHTGSQQMLHISTPGMEETLTRLSSPPGSTAATSRCHSDWTSVAEWWQKEERWWGLEEMNYHMPWWKTYSRAARRSATAKYLQRVKQVLRRQQGRIKSIHTYAWPIIRYTAGIIRWPKEEI